MSNSKSTPRLPSTDCIASAIPASSSRAGISTEIGGGSAGAVGRIRNSRRLRRNTIAGNAEKANPAIAIASRIMPALRRGRGGSAGPRAMIGSGASRRRFLPRRCGRGAATRMPGDPGRLPAPPARPDFAPAPRRSPGLPRQRGSSQTGTALGELSCQNGYSMASGRIAAPGIRRARRATPAVTQPAELADR